MSVTVKENPFTPEGKSDEISEYLPVGAVLYSQDEMTAALDEGKFQYDRAQRLQSLLIKLRDDGDWFMSAIELDTVDGEEMLKEVEALVGPRVQA